MLFDLFTRGYTVSVVGLSGRHNKVFNNRNDANAYMYKLCGKFNLVINEIWNDKHEKTYHCSNGVTFYIHRA